METMALDEMDHDYRHKSGREVIEDKIHDRIKAKEQEIRELREETKAKEQEIRELREEIRERAEQIRAVEKEIAIASGTEVRVLLEVKLQFLRQETISRGQQIIILCQQISSRDQQISSCDQQISLLRQEIISIRSVQEASASAGAPDNSRKWIESMSVVKPVLPRNKDDVTRVLFPDVHGKLPVTKEAYHSFTTTPHQKHVAEEYVEEADGSAVPVLVTAALYADPSNPSSEMDTAVFMSSQFRSFFSMFKTYSPHTLLHRLLFNCNVETGDSISSTTVDRSRPDTLGIASGRTLLIGEDKLKRLWEAEQDLRVKVKPLSAVFYGDLEFILGYVAAGSEFQWVYVGKHGGSDLSRISPCLDLTVFDHRCKFYLSLGYAYHLLYSMADSIPVVNSDHAMFSRDVRGDRTIYFYPNYVRKGIKNFRSYCEDVVTTVDAVQKAYEVAKGSCRFLPQRIRGKVKGSGTYTVEYEPVGYPPTVRSEQDLRNMARCVCEALHVLHTNGLVHRDIKLPNIVQISKDQFMLIDLETAAECPNILPPEFPGLQGWSGEALEGGVYTTMSDMYQLGILLASMRGLVDTMDAEAFIRQLISKDLSAEMALKNRWVSNIMP